jgi:SAM-dependent methyltransferase
MQALEARHLADLTFPEVSRALRALSSAYVERRKQLGEGTALSGAGKRAAFALFYGPLHYLLVRAVVRGLPGATAAAATLVDLGCGTGAAGAAWATAGGAVPRLVGIDRHPWAVGEAAHTYRAFGLPARAERGDASGPLPKSPRAVVAAFTVNELDQSARGVLLSRLLDHRVPGDRILIVEPIARSVTPWWNSWRDAFVSAGGRADEWRIPVVLPPLVAKLDRAAGLNHNELTARSLWWPAR